MSETETITVARDGLTLSGVLARHYREVISGACEQVWSLNQDLARKGAEIPRGTVLIVPVKDALTTDTTNSKVTGLFD
ncbi:tail protein X [Allorhizobium taibaishanense]|uniref:Phage tail protein X n=1 Tax=Allorhizobium taibaishanense TaxID=887144 RepID=A0A7W6MS93_9HYPH|nr:tail protein X [Allorhizobium taibaishanense]MBB4005793.1 phage tail protein X [Allorhizobium taibaishanense]